MRRLVAMTLLAGFSIGADAPKSDLDRLQGTWKTVRVESDGKEISTTGDTLVIRGDTFRASGSLVVEGTIKFKHGDPAKRYEKEAHRIGGMESRNRFVGLCSLEGDILKECTALHGSRAPTELASKPGSKHVLDVWKRTSGKHETGLGGNWILADRVTAGKRQGTDRTKGISMTVKPSGKEDEYAFSLKNEYEGQGKIELDARGTPKRIDLVHHEGGIEKDRLPGIYHLQSDQFVNCFSAKTVGERPTNFKTQPGDSRWVTVYRREVPGGLQLLDRLLRSSP